MAFTPPEFQILAVNTRNLDARLSTMLGRYQIVKNDGAASTGQITLEALIARTNEVIKCDTDRTTQREVFNQLVNELRDVLREGTEDQNKHATKFLLGALLHRYFRLLKEDDNYNLGFFKMWEVKTCRLFLAIRAALKLPLNMSNRYRQEDLNILDVTTIVTSLECFRDNMLKTEREVARYKSYPHFAKDANFLPYLQSIIDEHKRRGVGVLNQFKAILFIQSLVKQLEEELQQVKLELDKWVVILEKDFPKKAHPNFSRIDIETLELHIQAHVAAPVKEKIADLLFTPYIKAKLATIDHQSFVAEMKKCSLDVASYTAFGGYALLLEHQHTDENLKFGIQQVLQIVRKPEELSVNDRLNGLNFLNEFIERNPKVKLETEYFDGIDKLKGEISRQQLAATRRDSRAEIAVVI